MSRGSKLILSGVSFTLVVVFASVGAPWLAFWSALKPSPASRPPLADGLPRDFREAERVFSMRILNTFPVGSPEVELVRTLDVQGFRRREIEGVQHASFVQQSFPCKLTLSIDWSANANGRITGISAHYHPVCL